MPDVGLEMRRIKDLSVGEWEVLSRGFSSLMVELGYDSNRIITSEIRNRREGKVLCGWLEFVRLCKPEDAELLPLDVPDKEKYIGRRWYSLYFSTEGAEEEFFVPRELTIEPSVGEGSYFFKNTESIVMEKIEMLFLGPFRTYYKCLSPVTRNFTTEAERKESEENGFALAVLMDRQLLLASLRAVFL